VVIDFFMDKIVVEHLSLNYSDGTESLKDISLTIPANAITVLFGPAGGGKSTLLRVMNRLNDLADVVRLYGKVLLDGENILDPKVDVTALRRKVGMVFARPVVLPSHPVTDIRARIAGSVKSPGRRAQSKTGTVDEARPARRSGNHFPANSSASAWRSLASSQVVLLDEPRLG
jgi:ABC-type phosphate transport system ATPase subunit